MCHELEKIYAEGYAEGVVEAMLSSIKNLMETLGLSLETAMAALKIPESEQQTYAEQLKQL